MALSSQAAGDRPALEVHQGQFFRWAMPPGWQVSETIAGVSMNSPDQLNRVSSSILLRSFGSTTPGNFIAQILPMLPGVANARLMSTKKLPDQPAGALRSPWAVEELELTYQYGGVPARATFVCGISTTWGSFDAFVLAYQAPAERFEQERLWLWRIANSIAITNPFSVAGNNQLIPPRNNPLDNSALLESWRRKGLSDAHISKAFREGTMGYKRMKDTETGRIYEMPLEAFDGTIGGYRNPVRPTEILQETQPGE